ncbi:MAG: hypothetical protein AAF531_07250 [Actinomycetota bacterium]
MRAFEISSEVDDEERKPAGPLTIIGRVVAGIVIAASFGVWVYAYSGYADRETPDLLADRPMAETAESICAAALRDVEAMPNALDAVDGADRAEQIRATTARFSVMVDDLDRLDRTTERDDQIFSDWLSDWRVLLNDRLIYADAIAVDPNAQFYITDTGVNERLDRRVTRFANTNLIVSCAAPTDVG